MPTDSTTPIERVQRAAKDDGYARSFIEANVLYPPFEQRDVSYSIPGNLRLSKATITPKKFEDNCWAELVSTMMGYRIDVGSYYETAVEQEDSDRITPEPLFSGETVAVIVSFRAEAFVDQYDIVVDATVSVHPNE